jgi:diguanylate cyclase (GGDEF)-like protein
MEYNLVNNLDYTMNKKSGWYYIERLSLLRHGLLFVIWLGVWYISGLVEYTEHASVWFPAAGLTFAALFLLGLRAIPALMLAAMVVTIVTAREYNLPLTLTEMLYAGILFSIAHIIPYYLASRLLRWLGKTNLQSLPQFVISFLLVAACFSLLATSLVLGALILSNMMPVEAFKDAWLPFWIGDMAGVMVLAPLFAGLLSRLYPQVKFDLTELIGKQKVRASKQYKYKLAICILLITLSMLLAYLTQAQESAFAIFFLVIPHMWIACTENALFTVLSLAISSLLIALLAHVLGLMDYVMVYQFAINVVAANALFGLAVPALTNDNKNLRKMVFTDSLTQVASREHLVQRAQMEIHRSQQENKPLSLLVLDIDHFKKVNDEHGHSIGDQALKEISRIAQQSLRPKDVLGRFGGDEFVILLPNTTAVTVAGIANRILENTSRVSVIQGQSLSVSIGIAEMSMEDSFNTLFERADKALYKAKNSGRNRIQIDV